MARDLTVRLAEDRPGVLAGVVQALSRSGVNIEGIAEVEGVVHVLARDPGAARNALRSGGYEIDGELEVMVLPLPDRPGELAMIMQRLADAGVNVRFAYLATDTRVVIGADDVTRARQPLDLPGTKAASPITGVASDDWVASCSRLSYWLCVHCRPRDPPPGDVLLTMLLIRPLALVLAPR